MMLRTTLGRAALALIAGLALASSALAQTGTIGRAPATGGLPGTYAVGDLLCASSTSALGRLAAPAVGQVLKSNGVGVCPSWSASPSLTSLALGGATLGSNALAVTGTAAISGTLHVATSTSFSDLQAGGGVRFGTGVVLASAGTNQFALGDSTGATRLFASTSAAGYFQVDTAQFIGWSAIAGQAYNGGDLRLYRGGAGILEQRNGTNAQTFKLLRSWTDASNNEGLIFVTGSGYAEIATYASGTGAASTLYIGTRGNAPLAFQANNATLWNLPVSGHFAPNNTNLHDLGSAAYTVRTGYFGTSTIVGANTAIPAGGTAGLGYRVSSTSNFGTFFGSGAPSLSAAKGSLYLRSDGSGTTDRAYINTDGGTTWTALTTVG